MAADYSHVLTVGKVVVESVVHATEGRLTDLKLKWQIDNWPENLFRSRSHDARRYTFNPDPVTHPHVDSVDMGWWATLQSETVRDVDTKIKGNGRWNFFVDYLAIKNGIMAHHHSRYAGFCVWIGYRGSRQSDVVAYCPIQISVSYGSPSQNLIEKQVAVAASETHPSLQHALISNAPVLFWTASVVDIEATITIGDCLYSRLVQCAPSGIDMQQTFRMFYQASAMSDFTFISSDEKELKTNRIFLAANSDVFRAMFEHDTKERQSGICEVEDVDYETLKIVVDSFYGIDIEDRITPTVADKVFMAAEKYQLHGLKNRCVLVMLESISIEKAVDYFVVAEIGQVMPLLESVVEFVKEHYEEFVASGGVAEIMEKIPQLYEKFFDLLGKLTMGAKKRNAEEAGLDQEDLKSS